MKASERLSVAAVALAERPAKVHAPASAAVVALLAVEEAFRPVLAAAEAALAPAAAFPAAAAKESKVWGALETASLPAPAVVARAVAHDKCQFSDP